MSQELDERCYGTDWSLGLTRKNFCGLEGHVVAFSMDGAR